jgi:predicted nucleotidyltransferase
MRTLEQLEDPRARWLLSQLRAELLLRHGAGLVSLVLYGSRARGDERADSDFDLMLVADEPRHDDGLAGVRDRLESSEAYAAWVAERGRPELSLLPFEPSEALEGRFLYLDMVDDAVLVHDAGDFMRRRLEQLRERLRAWGSYKAWLGDGSYVWILRPGMRPGETLEL